MRGATFLFLLLASAAPPPPATVPEQLRRSGGYDLGVVYQKWMYWIEGHKGAAADALLGTPDELPELRVAGEPVLRFRKYNDFGHFLTGEIRTYCRPAEQHGVVPGTCHYLLRRAFVPHDAGTYGGKQNPVSRWMEANFDPGKLASHFRASGWEPGTDWWRQDAALMFAVLPSPLAMLRANATVVRLESRHCPAMAQAIAGLEGKRFSGAIDLPRIGPDAKGHVPWPHSVRTRVELRTLLPASTGEAVIDGTGPAFDALMSPILDAADDCEKAREAKARGA